jgi:hypothetical protein
MTDLRCGGSEATAAANGSESEGEGGREGEGRREGGRGRERREERESRCGGEPGAAAGTQFTD